MTRRPHRRNSTEVKLQLASRHWTDREASGRVQGSTESPPVPSLGRKYERGELGDQFELQAKARDYELTTASLERKVGQLPWS